MSMDSTALATNTPIFLLTHCFIFFARALGFEPRSKVLETSILPLNYARRKLKAIPPGARQLLNYMQR